MSYLIPEEIVDEVRRLCNIIDIISDYTALERKEKTTWGYALP